MTTKQIVHESAKRLKEIALRCAELDAEYGELFCPGVGICSNITGIRPWFGLGRFEDRCKAWQTLKAAIARWPKHGGDMTYPVPGGEEAYDAARETDSHWDVNSEYGRLRFELLDWVIQELAD